MSSGQRCFWGLIGTCHRTTCLWSFRPAGYPRRFQLFIRKFDRYEALDFARLGRTSDMVAPSSRHWAKMHAQRGHFSRSIVDFSRALNGSVWNIFPDHGVLIAGLKIPTLRFTELQWRLPGRIPWASLDTEAWDHLSEISPLVPSSSQHEGCTLYEETSSEAFHRWSRDFELRASSAMTSPVAKSDRSYHGRAKLCKPVRRRINAVVLKQTRPGELAQSNGFLNRATARWFKQLRRIQSYHHAVHSERATENYDSRLVLWSSIRHAVGFENGFETWWISRPYPMPGSPTIFPPFPPNSTVASIILEDFTQNYRRFEYWQHERRLQSCRHKVQESAKGIFSITRRPSKPPLDHLEDDITQEITVVDGAKGLISVPESYPQDSVHRWTLQGTPAWVWREGPFYRVETDLLLLDGQQLSCKVTIQDEAVIQSRLAQLWSPRWNKHVEVPGSHWNQIIDFARTHLPQDPFDLPDISVADWKKAVHQFKTTAASGPCGWSREDLLNLTTHQIQQALDFFSALEQGASWPDQMSVGLIHCLQKRDNVLSADGFRPITVTSMFYRVYAGIRAGQLLAILSRSASFMQCGFLKGHQASDIWYFVGICVEVSLQTSTPVFGCVADIAKAYNCLPRFPVFETLRTLGTPTWLLSLWSRHLNSFTRYFVVRRSCGMPLGSVTGFAEGCPLSCVAMCAIGHLWHRWQAYHSSQALPLSFVDNFELISARLPALHQGMSSLREFCSALDISIDESCLYHWSTSSEGRKDFRERGLKVSSGSRDLGGQVDYTAQLRNRVLTNRINDTFQWYQKLRSSKAPVAIKISNIQQVLFPRGLHGCEAIQLGATHLQKLRSQVMKALRWDRAGASPIIRLSLMHADLDPHWYQLWHCVQQFRRQFHHNSAVQDWWKMFCDSFKGRSNGPFGKLVDLLSSLGLNLTSDGRLWFSSNGYVILQAASDSLVRRILLWAHHNSFATQIQHREDFGDLDGCDVEITRSADGDLLPSDLELVQIARDGAFVTNKQRSKFDARKTGTMFALRFFRYFGASIQNMSTLFPWLSTSKPVGSIGLGSTTGNRGHYRQVFFSARQLSAALFYRWQLQWPSFMHRRFGFLGGSRSGTRDAGMWSSAGHPAEHCEGWDYGSLVLTEMGLPSLGVSSHLVGQSKHRRSFSGTSDGMCFIRGLWAQWFVETDFLFTAKGISHDHHSQSCGTW